MEIGGREEMGRGEVEKRQGGRTGEGGLKKKGRKWEGKGVISERGRREEGGMGMVGWR